VNEFSKWWVNGAPGDSISIRDRGLTYGDGLFETIAVRDGNPRFLDYHIDRLFDSCKRLDIPCPTDISDQVREIVAGCTFGTAKIILTRGIGARTYAPPEKPTPTRIIGLTKAQPPPRAVYAAGVKARSCQATVSINHTLAGMKLLGRLEQVMARSEWKDAQIREGLMRSDDGRIICGTMTNVFFVSNGNLSTPDLSRCGINGVMRRVVMEQAPKCSLDCVEVDIHAKDLREADEIFLTNSLIGIWPVSQLDEAELAIGPVTRRLMTELVNVGVAECAI